VLFFRFYHGCALAKKKMPKRKYYDTKKILITKCKRLKLILPMTMRRDAIACMLKARALHVIVTAIRRHILNKKQLVNDVDPISLEPVQPNHRWLVRERDRVYQFDVVHMISYLASEGVFRNPLTRLDFSDVSLDRLDHLCRRLDLLEVGHRPLVDLRKALMRERAESRERLRTLDFLDDECAQHLYAVVRQCSRVTTTVEMVNEGMDLFFRTLAVLEAMDIGRAEQCLVYCMNVAAVAFERSVTVCCADMRHAIFCLLTQRMRLVFGEVVNSPFAMRMALYSRVLVFVGDPNVPNTPFPRFEIM
jgi:hypothetical protein